MIRVTVLYPNTEGATFDAAYYGGPHLALAKEKLGDALKDVEFAQGIADGAGGPAAYAAVANMLFESIESFQQAFAAAGGDIMADIPNYTNVQPQIQIGEVLG